MFFRRFSGWFACLLAGLVVLACTAPASAKRPQPQTVRHAGLVDSASYSLGDRALTVNGLNGTDGRLAPMEITAEVHYPSNVRRGTHPLIMMLPGYWTTCADAHSEQVVNDPTSSQAQLDEAYNSLSQWPCRAGIAALPSYRGFDYLAQSLARRGFVVVSISANGANAIDTATFQGDQARAALISAHLHLWAELEHALGPLAHLLPRELAGHVNMHDVGLLGHSRGGRAVLQYAADSDRPAWPAGVRIAAVLALAPAADVDPDDDYTITGMPIAVISGTCDETSRPIWSDYFDRAATGSQFPDYEWTVIGANHDFYNTQWSPSSHQVAAEDDAVHDPSKPGQCADAATLNFFQPTPETVYDRQLTENDERAFATTWFGAYFASALEGRTQTNAILSGQVHIPGVVIRYHAAQKLQGLSK